MSTPRLPLILCSLGFAIAVSGCSQPWNWPPSMDLFSARPNRAESRSPDNPLILAQLSERRGQFDQAERWYREAISRSPDDYVAEHRLAVMFARQGRLQDADEQFRRALALKADDPELLSDFGYFCYLSHQFEDAERSLQQALVIEPGNSRHLNNLALVLGAQRRDQECLTLFRQAGPINQARVNYAFVLAQRGEYRAASDNYSRALSEDPSLRVAAEAMIELADYTDGMQSSRPQLPFSHDRLELVAQSPPSYPADTMCGHPRYASAVHPAASEMPRNQMVWRLPPVDEPTGVPATVASSQCGPNGYPSQRLAQAPPAAVYGPIGPQGYGSVPGVGSSYPAMASHHSFNALPVPSRPGTSGPVVSGSTHSTQSPLSGTRW